MKTLSPNPLGVFCLCALLSGCANTNIGSDAELYEIAVIAGEQGLGAGAFSYGDKAVGVYGTVFFGFGDNEIPLQDSDVILSLPHSNDPQTSSLVVPSCLSCGLTYGLTDIMGIYVGATYGSSDTYETYYDETHTLGFNGYYDIHVGTEDEWNLEYGMHLVAWGSTAIGVRRNLAIDMTLLTIGWGF